MDNHGNSKVLLERVLIDFKNNNELVCTVNNIFKYIENNKNNIFSFPSGYYPAFIQILSEYDFLFTYFYNNNFFVEEYEFEKENLKTFKDVCIKSFIKYCFKEVKSDSIDNICQILLEQKDMDHLMYYEVKQPILLLHKNKNFRLNNFLQKKYTMLLLHRSHPQKLKNIINKKNSLNTIFNLVKLLDNQLKTQIKVENF